MIDDLDLDHALDDVGRERHRQERLKAEGRFAHTCDELEPLVALACLTEEVGECCRAALAARNLTANDGFASVDHALAELRGELVQVAAIAVAMVEGLDRRSA